MLGAPRFSSAVRSQHDRRSRAAKALLLTAALLVGSVAHAGNSVERWTRKAGSHAKAKKRSARGAAWVNLQSHPAIVERTLFDPQYGDERLYRGVPLASLTADRPAGTDLAILHFKNGAIVPVSLDDAILRRIDALVAVAHKPADRPWQTTFPEMSRAPGEVDPRPLIFDGNKLVVAKSWHPYLKDSDDDGFSPWRWVDTLTGIEFVEGNAYFKQFVPKVGGKDVKRGLKTYLQSCQYCHSAHDVGSRYGGDFLRPFPLHTIKTPKDLYDHVTIQKMDAMQRGLMMPTQKNLEPADLAALMKWVEALSTRRKLAPYRPATQAAKPAPTRSKPTEP